MNDSIHSGTARRKGRKGEICIREEFYGKVIELELTVLVLHVGSVLGCSACTRILPSKGTQAAVSMRGSLIVGAAATEKWRVSVMVESVDGALVSALLVTPTLGAPVALDSDG